MSSKEEILNQTKAAIAALSNPSDTVNADRWLVDFERSTAAWEVSNLLLLEGAGSPFRFFGAKFLYSKIQKQFFQLSDSAVSSLAQTLVQHIIRLATEPTIEMNVCRYLCLSLAALAVQMNQEGVVSLTLQRLNPIITTSQGVVLELLMVLPEEAYNHYIDISTNTRDLFINQLSDSSNDVLNFLSNLLVSAGEHNEIKSKIIKTAGKWIDIARISPEVIVRQPVYQFMLQTLTVENNNLDEEMFENIVDALIVVLHRVQCKNMDILGNLFPVIINLNKKWQESVLKINNSAGKLTKEEICDEMEDEINLCRSICRLFTETAESCMDLFISPNSLNIGQEAILNQLLETTKFPYDPYISRIPLKFFYELSMIVKVGRDSVYHEPDHIKNGHPALDLVQKYLPIYQFLLEIALSQMMLSDVSLAGVSPIPEQKVEVRVEWKETVLDCCHVIEADNCLHLLCTALQQELSKNEQISWSKIESVLFSIQVIAPSLSKNENSYIPALMNLLLNSFTGGSLPLHLTLSSLILLGQLSFWLEEHPDFLPLVYEKLMGFLQAGGKITENAARSLLSNFSSSKRLPATAVAVSTLLSNMENIRHSKNPSGESILSLESDLFLLEGICLVISYLPNPVESEMAIKSVLLPIANELNTTLQNNEKHGKIEKKIILPLIEKLTIIFRFYTNKENNCISEMFMSVFTLFQRVLALKPGDNICEKICRLYKHAWRNAPKQFYPHLPILTAHLAEEFHRSPLAAFLYAGSICVSSYSLMNNGEQTDELYKMLWSFSNTFFGFFSSFDQFEQQPDVVEEYFFLVAKFLQYIPKNFVESSVEASTVVRAGLTGLGLNHRDAQKGILLFFERFVQLTTFWSDNKENKNVKNQFDTIKIVENSSMRDKSYQLVGNTGSAIVSTIFQLLTAQRPAYAMDESNGCISDVLWCLKKRFPDQFQVWVVEGLNQQTTDKTTSDGVNMIHHIATKLDLVNMLVNFSKNQKEFTNVLDRFELNCRRSCV